MVKRLAAIAAAMLAVAARGEVATHTNDTLALDPLAHPLTWQIGTANRETVVPTVAGAPLNLAYVSSARMTISDLRDGYALEVITGAVEAAAGAIVFIATPSDAIYEAGRTYEARARAYQGTALVAAVSHDYVTMTEAYCSTCKTVVVVSGPGSADAVTNGGASVDGQPITNGAVIATTGSPNAVTNGGASVDGQPITNGAIIATAAGAQLIWTNNQNAGGHALTNVNGLVVTGGAVRLVGTDVRISTPAFGDNPATKDYADSGATAYTTNAINRLVYPDMTTNAGITTLGFSDPAITNVLIDGAGKATLQFKPIPPIVWSYDTPPTSPSAWDDEFDAPLVTTNSASLATSSWYFIAGRTSHYYQVTNGTLQLIHMGVNTGYAMSRLIKKLPDSPPWFYVAKIHHSAWSNRQYAGISIFTTNGTGKSILLQDMRNNNAAGGRYDLVTLFTTPTALYLESSASYLEYGNLYYGWRCDGTNFEARFSTDGSTWNVYASGTTNNPFGLGAGFNGQGLGFEWDWVNGGQTNAVVVPHVTTIEWFRRVE